MSPIFLAFQAQVSCTHHGQNMHYYAELLDAESMATGDLPDAVEDAQDSQKLQLKGTQDEDALLCMDDAFAESEPRQASPPKPPVPLPLPRHRPASKVKDTTMTSSEASTDEHVVDAHDPPSPASQDDGHFEAAGVSDWLLEDDDENTKGQDPTVPAPPEEPLTPAALQQPLSSLLGLAAPTPRSPGDHLSDYSPSLPPDEDHDANNGLTEELLQQLGSVNFATPGDSAQSEPPTAISTAVEAHTDTVDASAIPAAVASVTDATAASAIPIAPDVPTDPGAAPRIPEAGEEASRVARAPKLHPDSFAWGSFRFTFSDAKKRPPHGQWQAKCRFHMLNQKTLCTRAMNVGPDDASKDLALRLLKGWCLAAPQHERKSTHAAMPLQQKDALPHEVLDARQRDMPPVPANVVSDAELDAIAAAEMHASPRPSAKRKRGAAESSSARPRAKPAAKAKVAAKRQAKSKAKVKAKAKAKVASKAEAKAKASASSAPADEAGSDPPSPADEAGSDPPTDSSSSSSSSSSSLSTDSTSD